MLRKLILIVIVTFSFFSTAVFAVGLGEYQVRSGLNQPLDAEITLLSVGDLELHEIKVSLANAAEFKKLGVERYFFLSSIKFKAVRNDAGDVVVKLSTRNPIKEPFLNFLVELNWPAGKFIREYTFLLDPPIFDDATASTIEKTNVTSRADSRSRVPRSSATPSVQQSAFTGSSYGPVSGSDTLWEIAVKVKPGSQATIHQTLVAIYRANPSAFSHGNINNLLKGKVLKIPDAETMANVPHRAALQDVVVQNNEWRSGGARRIVKNNDVATRSPTTSSGARLSLATPDNEGNVSERAGGDVRQKLDKAENELMLSKEKGATLQAENEELRVRLADALKKLESMQSDKDSAISVSDTELAVLSQNQKDIEKNAIESGGSETDSTDMDVADVDSSLESSEDLVENGAAEGVDDSTNNLSDEVIDDTSGSQVDAGTVTESSTEVQEPEINRPVVNEPPMSTSIFDDLMEYGVILWGGVAAVLLLVFAVFWRMRQRMGEEDFQEDLVASTGAGSLDSADDFELPDVGDDMLVELDMEDGEESGEDSDDENFDPLGEADIYIAYGKYGQAENLLLEAIDDNPIRSDIKVKLMECYSETENSEKFESLAQEVSRAIDADEWKQQIETLRSQAWGGASEPAADDEEDDEFDLPSTEDIFGEEEFEVEEGADNSLDLGLDDIEDDESELDVDLSEDIGLDELDTDEFGTDEELDSEFSLDDDDDADLNLDELDDGFSLDELDEGDDAFSIAEDASKSEADVDSELDIDAELDRDAEEPTTEEVTQVFDSLDDEEFSIDEDEIDEDEIDLDLDAGEDDLNIGSTDESDDISLDLDEDEFSFDEDSDFESEENESSSDEISTKIDLARAYIDMGDSEGAKEILSEVIAEGTQQQIDEAQALLEKA